MNKLSSYEKNILAKNIFFGIAVIVCIIILITQNLLLIYIALFAYMMSSEFEKMADRIDDRERKIIIEQLDEKMEKLKRELSTKYKNIEKYMNKNPEVLVFRKIYRDYDTTPFLDKYVYEKKGDVINMLERNISILQNNIIKRDNFYEKYFSLKCEHGVDHAFLYPHNCLICFQVFSQWKKEYEKKQAERLKKIEESQKLYRLKHNMI